MPALSDPTFDFAELQAFPEDRRAQSERTGIRHGRHKFIIGLYLISAPVATIAWLAALVRAAIWLVELALS